MKRLIDFSRFSSVRIGGAHEVRVLNYPDVLLKDEVVIGAACNILLSPTPPPLAILNKSFDYIKDLGGCLEIGAATKTAKIYRYAKHKNIGGFEFLKNIPGTLGGVLKMNAGLCGFEISKIIQSVLLFNGWVGADSLGFAYRKSKIDGVVFAARFELGESKFSQDLSSLLALKRANQPRGASFGSCFKNPNGDFAGRLIEAVGLKGHSIGGAMFSPQHANFLINFNKASFFDAYDLIKLAQSRVLDEFGISLEPEVQIL